MFLPCNFCTYLLNRFLSPISYVCLRFGRSVLNTSIFQSESHSQKYMTRNLNTRFPEKKTRLSYAVIICSPTDLITNKMPFMNTSVIVRVEFFTFL